MSSWAEEFAKINLGYKVSLATVAVLMPFWYVTIYYCDKLLFASNNIILLSCICFCLSVCWFLVSFGMSFLVNIFRLIAGLPTSHDEGYKGENNFIYGGQLSIFYFILRWSAMLLEPPVRPKTLQEFIIGSGKFFAWAGGGVLSIIVVVILFNFVIFRNWKTKRGLKAPNKTS